MLIRPYTKADKAACGNLFYNSVHTVCAKDYTKEQLDIWAPEVSKSGNFPRPLEDNFCFVALIDHQIVGFADITKEGYLDRFFVHKDFQKQGVGKTLLKAIEDQASHLGLKQIVLEASITARPFFEKAGYKVTLNQQKEIKGVLIKNFKMQKNIS